ncbi:MAG: hypothetical protein IJ071_12675 [Ruminococcus sp.]|nr:hypothetical protein [Ruminococcus sp.]
MEKKPFITSREEIAGSMIAWLFFVAIFAVALVISAKKQSLTPLQALHSLIFEEGVEGWVLPAILTATPLYILINRAICKSKKRRFISEGTMLEGEIVRTWKSGRGLQRLEIKLPGGETFLSGGTFERYDVIRLNKCTVYELNGEYIVTELYHKRSF